MVVHKSNWLLEKLIYPELTWKKETDKKVIYLTFDDGPIPEVTEFVLKTLEKYNAKGTFFCVGENIKKHPDIFRKIIVQGHSVGNHTYNHIKGWQTRNSDYFKNVLLCKEEFDKYELQNTNTKPFFRPPHGQIKKSQIKVLQEEYEIIMWNVLSGDYDKNLPQKTCLAKTIKYTNPGSIVVFHDSVKARKNMEYTLPKYLEHFTEKGFRFDALL